MNFNYTFYHYPYHTPYFYYPIFTTSLSQNHTNQHPNQTQHHNISSQNLPNILTLNSIPNTQNPPTSNINQHNSKKSNIKRSLKIQLIQQSEQTQGYNPRINNLKTKIICKNKSKPKLNKNRNVKQSLVQQFFSFLHNQKKSKVFVLKIMSEMNLESRQKLIVKYYMYFKNLKANMQKSLKQKNLTVLRPLQLKTTQQIEQQCEQQKDIEIFKNISRRLVYYFYSILLPIRVITSKKLKRSNDMEMIQSNLTMRRQILNNLKDWLI